MRSNTALLLALIVAALLAHEVSYGLNVQDDAFISFRYAANLVAGHGLVFNPGEPIEGYTNFFWTAALAAVLAVGGDPLLASVIGGMLASVGLVLVTWALGARLEGPRSALVAPALLAINAPFALESVQGLETTLFALFGLWALHRLVAEMEDERQFPWSSVLLSLAALTRPEGVLIFGLLHGARALIARPETPEGWRRLLTGWVIFGAVVVLHELLRLFYYGQPLPNTFYAKTGGGLSQLARGLDYLWRLARQQPMLSAAALLGLASMGSDRPHRSLPRLMVAMSAGYLAYVAVIGGDFKVTGRFIVPVLGVLAIAAQRFALAVASRGPRALCAGALVLALDAVPTHRKMVLEADYRAEVMDDRLLAGAYLRDHFPPDTLLAIHSSGTIPYVAGFPTIDMWGLSDLAIAHRQMPKMGEGMAGHEKTDFNYVFGRDPDVYVPEEDFITAAPTTLARPSATGFDRRWTQRSVRLGDKWFNFFVRAQEAG